MVPHVVMPQALLSNLKLFFVIPPSKWHPNATAQLVNDHGTARMAAFSQLVEFARVVLAYADWTARHVWRGDDKNVVHENGGSAKTVVHGNLMVHFVLGGGTTNVYNKLRWGRGDGCPRKLGSATNNGGQLTLRVQEMWGGALKNWPTEHWGLNEKRDPRQIGKVHETMRPRALGGGGSTKNCVHEHEAVGKAHLLTMKKGTPDAINSALVKWMPRIEKWEAFSSASDSFRTKSKPPPNRPTANRHHTDPKPTPKKQSQP